MSFRFNRVVRGLQVLVIGLPAAVSPMCGQAESESPANLQVFQRLAFEIGSDLGLQLPGGAASLGGVVVFPREIGLPLESELARGLGLGRAFDSWRDSSALTLELAVTEAQVVLEDPRRDGFLGPKIVDRLVTLAGRAKASREGVPAAYYDVSRSLRDTVLLSAVESLESPTLRFTKAALPRQGLFDSLIEPLVVLGAVGVAVYLLFAVRS